ncbi:uncharacterized protein F5891DRAFT_1193656 [Suillus fuscotomentosus]|uniref:Uncharacterized protein n=1 Tax=Suillus fuscotomentosus TaxID=1912939 RepID=A0AAD4HGM2_9AGAM|nr:uncharacterized protein F5891DRAFT_1193656 [Suillus fuscotomentosus]KAG1895843.1 hypothetical protein F5891DRAFT_1193656 [Suillus fuscotomentosus]
MSTPFNEYTRDTGSSSPENLDVEIHAVDILHFARLGFAASIKLLSEQHGFTEGVIQKVYRQLENYAEAMDIIEMMRDDAEERAVTEILKRHEDDSDEDLEGDEGVNGPEESKDAKQDQDQDKVKEEEE